MPKTTSIGQTMLELEHKAEIDARNASYAIAKDITMNVLTRFGDHNPKPAVAYFSELSDGIYAKIIKDYRDTVGARA